MVPSKRLELLRLSALPPQDSVSTNSTTTAIIPESSPGFTDLRQTCDKPYLGISVDLPWEPAAGAGAEEAGAAGCESIRPAGTARLSVTPPVWAGAPK
jgi:hypothetical protein